MDSTVCARHHTAVVIAISCKGQTELGLTRVGLARCVGLCPPCLWWCGRLCRRRCAAGGCARAVLVWGGVSRGYTYHHHQLVIVVGSPALVVGERLSAGGEERSVSFCSRTLFCCGSSRNSFGSGDRIVAMLTGQVSD